MIFSQLTPCQLLTFLVVGIVGGAAAGVQGGHPARPDQGAVPPAAPGHRRQRRSQGPHRR